MTTYANIDAALTYAAQAGVRLRYDVNGVVAAIQDQVGDLDTLTLVWGWTVEIGSKDGLPWHLDVTIVEATEDEDGDYYTKVTVPDDVAVTLSELRRGGVSIDFPPGPTPAMTRHTS